MQKKEWDKNTFSFIELLERDGLKLNCSLNSVSNVSCCSSF